MQFGRRAFGPQRPQSPATKARNIVRSMLAHPGRTIEFYGVSAGSELAELVKQTLEQMTAAQAA
jgi:hypothetical protein